MSSHRHLSLPVALALAGRRVARGEPHRRRAVRIAQGPIKQKAAEKAAEKAGKKIGEALGDKPATDTAKPAPATNTVTSDGSVAPTSRREWANYDFVPGARTIYFTDFSEDQVGNFPKRLTFKNGQMEVVELDGGQRALKASSYSQLLIPLPEALPQKFTIELDVINRDSRGVAANTFEITGGGPLNDTKYTEVGWGHNGLSVSGGGVEGMSIMAKDADVQRYVGHPASFRILGDGQALKLYADEKRIANIPNGGFQRGRTLALYLQGRDDEKNAVYVTRIRVAESNKDIYDELSASGPLDDAGHPVRVREVGPQARVDADAQGDRGGAEGTPRPQGRDPGTHRQRRLGGVEPHAQPGARRRREGRARGGLRHHRGPAQREGLRRHEAGHEERDAGRPGEQPPRRDREALTAARRD
jgi:hypothetical protein